MSLNLSESNEARLRSAAQAEGISVDTLVEHWIDEHEEFSALIDRAAPAAPPDDPAAKIERAYAQSERGEVADGEEFVAGLIAEMEEDGRGRRAG